MKLLIAADLFKEGSITLRQAADLAELSSWDLLHELGKMKISFTNIDIDDLKKELDEI